ncbi:prepilin-type N-terminal cleavage/methylation domain-containing protein [Sulfurimonas sp.]|uniref:prepilin-type N-terminal cleavage/methylation domain-containing protein n=1 Tax=Sulfurimonas sp. TaxID=2022749 RepID=UPI0025CFFBB1|nr:prepilin-type N-terminal cleavage/methylation domain-containing protein [Sulfurimonas sp.]
MKKAFTMLELVFVLVIIGILAAVMLPQMQSTKLREAAIQVVSHIRYTQHLAMVDDKFDSTDASWYKLRWQIVFSDSAYSEDEVAYSVYTDKSKTGSPNSTLDEVAINPIDKNKLLSGGHSGTIYTSNTKATKTMNLGLTYNISDYDLDGGCSGARITFDHLGRPINGTIHNDSQAYENNSLIETTCNIILTSPEGSVTIAIEPETGYAHILDS